MNRKRQIRRLSILLVFVGMAATGSWFSAARNDTVELINGYLASEGDADYTGALQSRYCADAGSESCWKTICSGVLVAPNAILTAGHCFDACGEGKCRFFLQGVGSVDVDACEATSKLATERCRIDSQVDGLAPDLAFATLRRSVTMIRPPKLAENWQPGPGKKVRVSGFGSGYDDMFPGPIRLGLKQVLYAPVSPCGDHNLCLANGGDGVGFSWGDSGGPLVHEDTHELLGIVVRKSEISGSGDLTPSRAVRLTGPTYEWVKSRIPNFAEQGVSTVKCLLCPQNESEEIHTEPDTRSLPTPGHGQQITVTVNSVMGTMEDPGATVDLEISRGGAVPDLCEDSGMSGLQEKISWSESAAGGLHLWFKACRENTVAQILYTTSKI